MHMATLKQKLTIVQWRMVVTYRLRHFLNFEVFVSNFNCSLHYKCHLFLNVGKKIFKFQIRIHSQWKHRDVNTTDLNHLQLFLSCCLFCHNLSHSFTFFPLSLMLFFVHLWSINHWIKIGEGAAKKKAEEDPIPNMT